MLATVCCWCGKVTSILKGIMNVWQMRELVRNAIALRRNKVRRACCIRTYIAWQHIATLERTHMATHIEVFSIMWVLACIAVVARGAWFVLPKCFQIISNLRQPQQVSSTLALAYSLCVCAFCVAGAWKLLSRAPAFLL